MLLYWLKFILKPIFFIHLSPWPIGWSQSCQERYSSALPPLLRFFPIPLHLQRKLLSQYCTPSSRRPGSSMATHVLSTIDSETLYARLSPHCVYLRDNKGIPPDPYTTSTVESTLDQKRLHDMETREKSPEPIHLLKSCSPGRL